MNKIWKKNLVAAALLVTVCVGIYANWSYTQAREAKDLTDTLNEEKILSDDMLVMADDEKAEALQTTTTDYFAAVFKSEEGKTERKLTFREKVIIVAKEKGIDLRELAKDYEITNKTSELRYEEILKDLEGK